MKSELNRMAWWPLLVLAAATNVAAQDVPDPYFIDSNGDGIDGELNLAVFVAPPPLGNDNNDGLTPSTPVATIGWGMQVAQAQGFQQVLVQVGSYNESLVLQSGIGVYGGYDAQWLRVANTTTTATIVQGGTTAVLAQDLNQPTTLSFLTLRSADATVPGESSYAVRLVNSMGPLELRYNRIEPGRGATGVHAPNAAPRSPAQAPGGNNGQNAMQSNVTNPLQGGPGGGNAACPDATNVGGKGGSGGVGATGLDGQDGMTGSGNAGGGVGGPTSTSINADGADGSNGQPGAQGAAGMQGTAAPSVVGTLNAQARYVPPQGMAGVDGGHGRSGGGGGGGGGQDCSVGCNADLGASGGGGGAGGCGGFGAQSGAGGGASLGISIDTVSNAVISHNHFKPSLAGAGGNGGHGGAPQTGGSKGQGGLKSGTDGGNGGDGGMGGNGGPGGSGAGGHGGPALGILDPLTRANVSSLRYTAASNAAPPGANGSGNASMPQIGLRALRHPTSISPLPPSSAMLVNHSLIEPISGVSTQWIPIQLSFPTQDPFSAGYAASNGSAEGGGIDFTLADGSVVFNPWTTQATIAVQVHADAVTDSGETFTLALTGAVIGPPVTITILEDRLFMDGFD